MSEVDIKKLENMIEEMSRDNRLNAIKVGKYNDLKDSEKSVFNFNEDAFNEFANIMNNVHVNNKV